MPTRSRLEARFLEDIVHFYLNSPDFNGVSLDRLLECREAGALDALKKLVQRELVEVISGKWDNPHIKRLPAYEVAKQLEILTPDSAEAICVYPSEKHMRGTIRSNLYRNRPFTRLLALSHPQIEPNFFELSVLDRYQSDPRYIFRFDGLAGSISITDQHYRSRGMVSSDKVILGSFGLGSDARGQKVAVVFLRYLSSLTPRHQQHWQSQWVRGNCAVEGNYYRRSILGEWTDGISVYDALLAELFHINAMCARVGMPPLFIQDFSGERPKGFGLLMRPTRREYHEFAHILDKLISENLNLEFFEAEGLSVEGEATRSDGRVEVMRKASLRLLQEWLGMRIRFKVDSGPARIMATLREVRALRQKPAHAMIDDEFSPSYQKEKERLISDVYMSISNIRAFFQTHPQARDYTVPKDLKFENIVLY
jgi:hypothetical protein